MKEMRVALDQKGKGRRLRGFYVSFCAWSTNKEMTKKSIIKGRGAIVGIGCR